MTRIALTLAILSAIAAPAMAYPTGVEIPTLTWPEPTVAQSCVDPATLDSGSCITR